MKITKFLEESQLPRFQVGDIGYVPYRANVTKVKIIGVILKEGQISYNVEPVMYGTCDSAYIDYDVFASLEEFRLKVLKNIEEAEKIDSKNTVDEQKRISDSMRENERY